MIVNMHQAKSQLSKLVEQASKGEEIVIARDGKPVARLVAIEGEVRERQFGLHEGLVKVPEDFNEPLPEGFDGLA